MAALEDRIAALEARIDELEKSSVESQLDEWKSKIDELRLQANLAKMDGEDEVRSALDRVSETWTTVRDRLERLVEDGRTAGESLASGLKSAGGEVRSALDQARETLMGHK